MDSLVKSQIITLFKKYDYYISEFETKLEISTICHNKFKSVIEDLLKEKQISGKLNHEDQNMTSSDEKVSKEEIDDEEDITRSDNDENIKSIYRKITKLTHPDIIKNEYMNSLYIKSTIALRKNDILDIYRIAVVLEIDLDFPEDFVSTIQANIVTTQKKISFIESSYHMRWYNSDKKGRIAIILEYLNKYLN